MKHEYRIRPEEVFGETLLIGSILLIGAILVFVLWQALMQG